MTTCSRCAERHRETIEAAAAGTAREWDNPGVATCMELAGERIRALASSPQPCDCAERDRVVEAAVEHEQALKAVAKDGSLRATSRWEAAAAELRDAVAALEASRKEVAGG